MTVWRIVMLAVAAIFVIVTIGTALTSPASASRVCVTPATIWDGAHRLAERRATRIVHVRQIIPRDGFWPRDMRAQIYISAAGWSLIVRYRQGCALREALEA